MSEEEYIEDDDMDSFWHPSTGSDVCLKGDRRKKLERK